MPQTTIAILGAGSWGSAVAVHLAAAGHRVLLWTHRAKQAQEMKENKANSYYLPDIIFPENLEPSDCLESCIQEADYVIAAVPSHAFASLLNQMPAPKNGLAWITKGIDPESHNLLSQLVLQKLGRDYPIAMISGPSFAKEVARFLPTALTLAGNDKNFTQKIQHLFHHKNVRVYLSDDLIGLQICGAVKNVLAIACGISDGLGFGANAKAAIITRGLTEMSRLGISLGAQAETFLGLAGVGDLVLTCTDNQSRNRRFGLLLGQKVEISEAEAQIGQVVEGKSNASQVCWLAKQQNIEMPICEQIHRLLEGKTHALNMVEELMSRPPKEEHQA